MRRCRRPSGWRAAALLLAVVATGCSPTSEEADALGGSGLPRQIEGEDYGGEPVEVEGTLLISERGCFLLGVDGTAHVTVWPATYGWGGDAVIDPEGGRLERGLVLRGEGRFVPVADFPGGPDGYWASELGFCDIGTDVLVLDRVEPAP